MADAIINTATNKLDAIDAHDEVNYGADTWPQGDLDLYDATIDSGTDFTKPYQAYNFDHNAKTCNVGNIAYLEVTTDATDSGGPVDGIPDIAANGSSTCQITVTKRNSSDDSVDTSGSETVYVETTGGNLSAQSVGLSSGVGSVTLTSVNEQKCVTVTAYDPNGGMTMGTLKIQFK